jgi:hypothetical protein
MTNPPRTLLMIALGVLLPGVLSAGDVEMKLDAGDAFRVIDSASNERFRISEATGNVGIGSSSPAGRLHVESALGSVGTVFRLPDHLGLPDPTYTHDAVLQWKGGEQKFGSWRNYFNGWEQDWAIAYNAPWDYTNNTWLGRDSGDPRANIAAYMRFNVAEGASGRNTFEITFAPPGSAGTPPDWNAASQYWFYDGRIQGPGGARAAEFRIRGAAEMEAMVHLVGHGSVDPDGHLLVSDKDMNFKIETAGDSGLGPTNRETRLLIDSNGAVGIATDTPATRLEVADGDLYASEPGSGFIAVSPDGLTCRRIGIDNSGALVASAIACP